MYERSFSLSMPSSAFRNFAQCGDDVGCYALLGNNQQQRVFIKDRIAITKLGSVINVDIYTRELFEHVLAGQSRMPGRAASSDLDRRESLEICLREALHLVEKYLAIVERDAAFDGLAHGARLLLNLLEPEGLEAAF